MPMDPAIEQVFQAALALPEEARVELAEALLATQDESNPLPFDPAWLSEIARRANEIKTGAVLSGPWHVVRQRVRRRLEERSSG